MSAAIMRFIVLGKIPGTDTELGFGLLAFLLSAVLSYLVLKHGVRLIDSFMRRLNPLYRSRLRTETYDLISS